MIPLALLIEVLCSTMTLDLLGWSYHIRIIPGGDCKFCCSIQEDDVLLHIYTKSKHKEYYHLYTGPEQLKLLSNGKMNIIYIHGFSEGSMPRSSPQNVKEAFFRRDKENVVLVDWGKLAALPWYPQAIANTRYVAQLVADFIDEMVYSGIPLYQIHVIGFSLGAEISGLVGNLITCGKLPRITGLDPAFPLYAPVGNSRKLSADDAEFVDVIHTDAGIFGFPTPMGHVDFFPNGGVPFQPGCSFVEVSVMRNLYELVACSHLRAWRYYVESVLFPHNFPASLCPSYIEYTTGSCPAEEFEGGFMGYKVNTTLRGTYFLTTRNVPPYGLEGSPETASEIFPVIY